MSDAAAKSEWSHTSAILSMLYNLNRDPKKSRPRSPLDFDPTRTATPVRKATREEFRAAFGDIACRQSRNRAAP